MDIDRVRYFHVFSEVGSLVKASEVLHISQPALSKALRLLETEVGVKLVEPEGRGLKLTATGVAFKAQTAPLLQQWLNISKKIKLEKAPAQNRIGSFEVFTTYFLGHLANYINLDSLELHEYAPGRLEQALSDNHIDIGITYAPIPKSGIEFVEVTKICMGVFGVSKFKKSLWSQLPFAVPLAPIEGTPSKVIGLDGWPDHKFQRQIKYRVTMMESAVELCRQGNCVAYLPKFVVELHNQMVTADFKLTEHDSPVSQKERSQSVFLVRRKNTQESSLQRQIAKSLRALS